MRFALRAPQNDTEYQIVAEAPVATGGSGPWPAMLFLDGDDQFTFAVDAYRDLRDRQEVPPLLLVGVGYGASYREPRNRRGRDYTPTTSSEEPQSGGADAFLAFLTDTLWPELGRRWPVREDLRGIGGHSVGALLVLHALFQSRPFFRRHLASAPSIWWDNRAVLCHARQLRSRQSSLPAHLFLTVGGKDSASMLHDLDMLADQLGAEPFENLSVMRKDFPERDHYDVLPDAFRAGLRELFGTS